VDFSLIEHRILFLRSHWRGSRDDVAEVLRRMRGDVDRRRYNPRIVHPPTDAAYVQSNEPPQAESGGPAAEIAVEQITLVHGPTTADAAGTVVAADVNPQKYALNGSKYRTRTRTGSGGQRPGGPGGA
jgi:hypothetical protein